MIQRQRKILCQVGGAQTWCEDDCVNFSLIFLDENTEKHAKDGEGEKVEDKQSLSFAAQCHTSYTFFTILQSCSAGLHDAFETFDSLFSSSSHSFQSFFFKGGKKSFFPFPHYSSYSSLVTEQ